MWCAILKWRDEVGLWTGVGLCVGWSEVEKWRKRFRTDLWGLFGIVGAWAGAWEGATLLTLICQGGRRKGVLGARVGVIRCGGVQMGMRVAGECSVRVCAAAVA